MPRPREFPGASYDAWKTTEPPRCGRCGSTDPGCGCGDLDPEDNNVEEQAQCDCCGEMWPIDDIAFIRAGALGNSAGCDTHACPICRQDPEERALERDGFPEYEKDI